VKRIDVYRKENAERDKEYFRFFVNTESNYNERDKREVRHVTNHLQGRVGKPVTDFRQTIGEAKCETYSTAYGETRDRAQQADLHIARQIPRKSEMPSCGDNGGR
jgi:hypothetical protein